MNYIEIIRNTIIFIAVCINIYILINLFLEKNAREKDENYEIKNNKLNIVAIDGFRLALRTINLPVQVNDFKAVIPGRTLNEINKIL